MGLSNACAAAISSTRVMGVMMYSAPAWMASVQVFTSRMVPAPSRIFSPNLARETCRMMSSAPGTVMVISMALSPPAMRASMMGATASADCGTDDGDDAGVRELFNDLGAGAHDVFKLKNLFEWNPHPNPLLSDGRGKACAVAGLFVRPSDNRHVWTFKQASKRFSLAHRMGEGRGEGKVHTNFYNGMSLPVVVTVSLPCLTPLGGGELVGDLADGGRRAADDEHFQAVVVVEMDVDGGQDAVVVVVLDASAGVSCTCIL